MNIHVVLVKTMYSRNIGAAARALANMGGHSLILVAPQCEVNSQSREAAAGAQEWLARRRMYKTWSEFYAAEGEGIRIGLTCRPGKTRKLYPLEQSFSLIEKSENVQENPHLYLFFGPEDCGLDNDDLAYMNYNCELPILGEFKSLNLSQAVLLTLFVVNRYFSTIPHAPLEKKPNATYFPDEKIKRWLAAMGFSLTARRSSAYLTLRRIFLHNNPTQHEREVLDAILQQNIRKLEEYNSLKRTT